MGHNLWRCSLCEKEMMAGGMSAHLFFVHDITEIEHKTHLRLSKGKVVARWIRYTNI
jgi:hypothetical protein